MSSNECYARAMELQMLAHYEAMKPGTHLAWHAPNPMAAAQPILHASADCQQYAFVPISPMRSSRAKALKSTGVYPSEPPLACNEPTHPVNYPPHHRPSFPTIHGPSAYTAAMPQTPNLPSYFINGSHTAQVNTIHYFPPPNLPPQHFVHGHHLAQMNAYPLFPAPSVPGFITFDSHSSDMGAATARHHGSIVSNQPAAKAKQRARTASKWSDICFPEPKHQSKKEAKADICTPEPKKQAKKEAKRHTCRSKSKKKAATKAKTASAASKTSRQRRIKADPDSELDVLCGRGGVTNKCIGNVRFRDEVRKLRGAYQRADNRSMEKRLIIQELLDRVKEYGGRFVKKGFDGKWYELNGSEAWTKASQALRESKWK